MMVVVTTFFGPVNWRDTVLPTGEQTPASGEIKSETVVVPFGVRVPLVELRKLVALKPTEVWAVAVHAREDVLDELLKVNVQTLAALPSGTQYELEFELSMVVGVTARIAGNGVAVGDGATVGFGVGVGCGLGVDFGLSVGCGVGVGCGVAVGDGTVIVT
jgi:hypothetical protein